MANQFIREVMIPSNVYFQVAFDTPEPSDEEFQKAAVALVESLKQLTRGNDDPTFAIPALPGGRACISVEEIQNGGLDDLGVIPDTAPDREDFDFSVYLRRLVKRANLDYNFAGNEAEPSVEMFP